MYIESETEIRLRKFEPIDRQICNPIMLLIMRESMLESMSSYQICNPIMLLIMKVCMLESMRS